MIDLRTLGLVLSCCACTPTTSDRVDEMAPTQHDEQLPAPPVEPPSPSPAAVPDQPPAPPPPCSVDAMLLRDTPITTFEYHCPQTLLPPEGKSARCIANSIAAELPFVTELVMPKPMPPHEQPRLVGATFNGRYEVRIYQDSQRIKVKFEQPGADGELGFTVDPSRLRCMHGRQLPSHPPADQWLTLSDNGGHRFAPDACVEWFDARQWVPRFNPAVPLVCTAHAPAAEPEPEPEPPKVEVDPVSARACEAGDGTACVAAANSVAPTGAYRVYLKAEEADRRVRETAKYAALGCELDQGEACLLLAHFGPWRDRDVPLTRGCELGHACACAHLGSSLTLRGAAEDEFRRGLDLLERACEAGHRDDQHAPASTVAHTPGRICDDVERLHRLGRESILEPSASKAAKYRRLACKQGYMLGCPCKQDEDCGGAPYDCYEGSCSMPSDCVDEPDDDGEADSSL